MIKHQNDGNITGMKADKYHHSRFEFETPRNENNLSGVSTRNINTLGGGKTSENRGHRGTSPDSRKENPYENGKLKNWNHRVGWDSIFDHRNNSRMRNHGGAQIGHDKGNYGKGPKGYKRSDENLYQDICEALALNSSIDASQIEVEVKGSCAYLKGKVQNRTIKKMVEAEIENISGLIDVQNLLTF
ncbi:MAG: BON domain-containing protein [Candidatus Babeliales bacterium]